MIKPVALVMAAAMTAVSAGTYFGLNLLPPGLLPPPLGREQPPAPPAPAAAPTETAAAAVPVAAEPAPPPAEPPVTEQDLAEDPPPAPTEQAAASQPVTEPQPEPQSTPPPSPPAPALVDEAPAAKPAAAPKKRPPVDVAREDGDASATQVAKAGPADAPKSPKPAPPDSDAIKPWWPDASKLPANQLKLQYAGQVQGEQAIALLFSAPLNLDSLRQHAQIKSDSGQAVSGGWELGKNPRLAVFRGVEAGRYTVLLNPQVADAKGFMLGRKLTGPVYIQP